MPIKQRTATEKNARQQTLVRRSHKHAIQFIPWAGKEPLRVLQIIVLNRSETHSATLRNEKTQTRIDAPNQVAVHEKCAHSDRWNGAAVIAVDYAHVPLTLPQELQNIGAQLTHEGNWRRSIWRQLHAQINHLTELLLLVDPIGQIVNAVGFAMLGLDGLSDLVDVVAKRGGFDALGWTWHDDEPWRYVSHVDLAFVHCSEETKQVIQVIVDV